MTRPEDRDPAVDSAWRTYSIEVPPPALDAKILAAAHREAKSRPRAAGDDDTLAEAREPSRWWWGLAAAATIGAIAFGMVQLAPPPVPQEATTASDVPDAKPGASTQPAAAPQVDAQPQPIDPPSPAEPAATAKPFPATKREAERKQALTPGRRPDAADLAAARRSPPSPVPEQAVPVPPAAAPAPPPPAPAAPAPAALSAAGAPPAISPPPAPKAAAAEAPAPIVVAPPAAGRARMAAADESRAEAGLAKAALTPEEYVRQIQRALDEGRTADARQSLEAFRAAHPDADRRLPPALRAWAATIPRKP